MLTHARWHEGAFWCDTVDAAPPIDSQPLHHPLGHVWVATDTSGDLYLRCEPEHVERILADFCCYGGGGAHTAALLQYHTISHWCDSVLHPFQEAELSCHLSKKDCAPRPR